MDSKTISDEQTNSEVLTHVEQNRELEALKIHLAKQVLKPEGGLLTGTFQPSDVTPGMQLMAKCLAQEIEPESNKWNAEPAGVALVVSTNRIPNKETVFSNGHILMTKSIMVDDRTAYVAVDSAGIFLVTGKDGENYNGSTFAQVMNNTLDGVGDQRNNLIVLADLRTIDKVNIIRLDMDDKAVGHLKSALDVSRANPFISSKDKTLHEEEIRIKKEALSRTDPAPDIDPRQIRL